MNPHHFAMRVVIQRVLEASVTVEGNLISQIGPGLLVLLGIEDGDGSEDISWLSSKIAKMRIFSDTEGKMNLSVMDLGKPIGRGVFGADMKISLVNDGPVTILIDSRHRE